MASVVMPNVHKANVVATLRDRFGQLHKIAGSESLFRLGDDAARVYIRYSKVHPNGRTFFGLREVDLRQLEGHNGFLCFVLDDGSPPLLVPYGDFEEIFRAAETAKDGQYKLQLVSQGDARELYIARQGRFKVTLDTTALREVLTPGACVKQLISHTRKCKPSSGASATQRAMTSLYRRTTWVSSIGH
jgi:hypothetical protein